MPAATVWTDHLLKRLAKLHADPNKSFRDIAEQLGREFGIRLSKNACIGRARRLGLAQRPKSTPKAPRRRTPRPPEPPAEVVPVVRPAWKVEPPVLVGRNRVTIYQLQRGVCHFPFGDKPPYVYCGNTTTRSSPWCPHHERVVYPRGNRA